MTLPVFVLWIVIGAVAMIVDIATSAFLFVWFTAGAVGALVAYALGYSVLIQFIVFIAVSMILILVCYPIIKKNIKNRIKPTPLREDTYKGRLIVIDGEMEKSNAVRIDGVLWNIDNDDIILKKGDRVKVIGINGNKILIQKEMI